MEILKSQLARLQDLLPNDVMKQVYGAGKRRRYTDGELIQQRGNTHQGISLLMSGHIVAGNSGADGSFLVSSMLQPGECFGEFTLFAGLPRTHDLTAAGDVEVLDITRRAFFSLMDRESEISRALLCITLRRSHDLLEFMDSQRRLSLPARVAKLIARMLTHQEDPEKADLIVQCRQEEMAFMLGVSRVSISHSLKSLCELGLIKTGYRKIEVNDAAQLQAWIDTEALVVPVAGFKLDAGGFRAG